MELKDIQVPASRTIALMVVEQVRMQIAYHSAVTEELKDAVEALVSSVGQTIEVMCDSGDYKTIASGRGVVVIVSQDHTQVGSYDLEPLLKRDVAFSHDFSAADLWTALIESMKENRGAETAAVPLVLLGKEGAEEWLDALKNCDPDSVPFLVCLAAEKEKDGRSLVGGILVLPSFPFWQVNYLLATQIPQQGQTESLPKFLN